jgi:hypothetical protein
MAAMATIGQFLKKRRNREREPPVDDELDAVQENGQD